MLSGPGAISTTILLQNEAKNIPQHVALYGCIVAVLLVSYLILRVAARRTLVESHRHEYSVQEAADILGINYYTMYRLIQRQN